MRGAFGVVWELIGTEESFVYSLSPMQKGRGSSS